ncbi:short-chain dehydrogenase [Zalerion maritima]|uniref:Short-chain dehydrogenase n=1 Tax=Zalerion maritima TaxID=339359 RepID=A0AAD5WQ40_9PEZI|nr:short-chain dehydrogenase [Zalerion maritima]
MATLAKTVVATGASSGLGFEAIKQLLGQGRPYKFILGARDTARTQAAYDELKFDTGKHSIDILPLELSNLKGVKTFAQQTLSKLGNEKLDYLFLNAGMISGAEGPGPNGSKWCEAYVVNHLSQHYLMHLIKEKLMASKSRVVVVSSGAVRNVPDTSVLEKDLKAGAGTADRVVYCETKFVQLLGAHWWRRELKGKCDIVAVSPGLIPNTGLARNSTMKLTVDMPDAKTVPEGAASLLLAFTKDDFPEDPDQIFLTSWGEWWSKDVIANSLDKELQEKWTPGLEQIEKEEGI